MKVLADCIIFPNSKVSAVTFYEPISGVSLMLLQERGSRKKCSGQKQILVVIQYVVE